MSYYLLTCLTSTSIWPASVKRVPLIYSRLMPDYQALFTVIRYELRDYIMSSSLSTAPVQHGRRSCTQETVTSHSDNPLFSENTLCFAGVTMMASKSQKQK